MDFIDLGHSNAFIRITVYKSSQPLPQEKGCATRRKFKNNCQSSQGRVEMIHLTLSKISLIVKVCSVSFYGQLYNKNTIFCVFIVITDGPVDFLIV